MPSSLTHLPRSIRGLAGVVLTLAGAANPASAQMLAQATPTQIDLTVPAGDSTSRSLFLHNFGKVPLEIRLRLADLTMSPSGELELLALGSTPTSIERVVALRPTRLTVRPGRRGAVRVTVRMPRHGPASRRGVILSEVRALGPDATPAVEVRPAELGTTVFVTRLAADSIRAELTELAARPGAGGSVAIGLRLRNRCGRHLVYSGEVAVLDSTRRTIERGRLVTGVVLPGAERRLSWHSETRLPPGRYVVVATVDAGEPALLVGETEVAIERLLPEPTAGGDDEE